MASEIPLASRIIVALDVDELTQAEAIAADLKGMGVTFKIGNQLGTYEGWRAAVGFARKYGAQIFCDTKYKDIPVTVEKSARAITRHQPDIFNIMADNSLEALGAAVAGARGAVKDFNLPLSPKILGVTVLTSINEEASQSIYGGDSQARVLQFAELSAQAGLDGVVCSPREALMLKQNPATKNLLLVTPGIRPAWAAGDDQARIMTPQAAIAAGVDYMVIGRPITQPPAAVGSPRQAVEKIIAEIS